MRTPHVVEATDAIALVGKASRPEFLPSYLENRTRFEVEFPTIGRVEDRTFKLGPSRAPGYGGYVKFLWGARHGLLLGAAMACWAATERYECARKISQYGRALTATSTTIRLAATKTSEPVRPNRDQR